MAVSLLKAMSVIAAAVEGTYNTDASPGASDAIQVENLGELSLEGLRMHDRQAVKGTFGPKQATYGGHLAGITFDVKLKGSGTVGTAPEWGVLMKACGFAETVVASTSVTYDPSSGTGDSLTINYYMDGKLQKLTGARGNVSCSMDAGGAIILSFTFTGHHAESDTPIVSPTLDSTQPIMFKSASFAIGGYSAVIGNLSFDMGNSIATPPNPNETDGYGEIQITNRDVTGSFDPEDTKVATNDWLGDLKSGTSMALATGTLGATAGNKVAISMPAVYYRELSGGDRDGIRTKEVGFGAVESSGDDQVSIVLT